MAQDTNAVPPTRRRRSDCFIADTPVIAPESGIWCPLRKGRANYENAHLPGVVGSLPARIVWLHDISRLLFGRSAIVDGIICRWNYSPRFDLRRLNREIARRKVLRVARPATNSSITPVPDMPRRDASFI